MSQQLQPWHCLMYDGIEAINRIVEQLDQEDAHQAISILREHLEARAAQTAPREDFNDVLGL